MTDFPWRRRLGAAVVGDGLVEFRVWAPRARELAVVVGDGAPVPLADTGHGVFEGRAAARPGDPYVYRLHGGGDGEGASDHADPCGAAMPEGIAGPSAVDDPAAFAWSDDGWGGVALGDLVVYELHVGTFTDEGTFDAAIAHLGALAALGVTAIELMPVATFGGRFGWGYDGVYTWAPHPAYGGPEGLRRLVDAAHAAGLGVILDVVYNHVGSPDTALSAFGPYFTSRYAVFWGDALNYDDADCDPVREWALQNAERWVTDFHVDGLRLDAIHAVYDTSARPVLAELAERVHAARPAALVIAESGLNDPKVIRPADVGGWGHDAQWADDFHHALRVLLTGDAGGYYGDFGAVADLAKAFRRPFVHDGTWSDYRRRVHGAPAFDRPAAQFVVFAQDHDQVGNRAFGDRLPAEARRLAALCVLLSPFTPMLFMGEEYGEPAPFQFFADHPDPEIARLTREGRRREFAAFAAFAGAEVPDPGDPATFARSTLTRVEEPGLRDLYRELLGWRRELAGLETDEVTYDEDERWLRVARGPYELVAAFGPDPAVVPTGKREICVATHPSGTELSSAGVALAPRSGALLR